MPVTYFVRVPPHMGIKPLYQVSNDCNAWSMCFARECYIPVIRTKIILYSELRPGVMTRLSKYVYGLTLCLRIKNYA